MIDILMALSNEPAIPQEFRAMAWERMFRRETGIDLSKPLTITFDNCQKPS